MIDVILVHVHIQILLDYQNDVTYHVCKKKKKIGDIKSQI